MDFELFNLNERAKSTHHNDAHSIGRRSLESLLRILGARRRDPVLEIVEGNDGTQSEPDTFCVGLEVTKLSTTQVRVHPGMLVQASPANLTLGALDAASQAGGTRAAIDVTVPVDGAATGGNYYLMTARVVATVALNELVDVWNGAGFVPASRNKRIEHTLEFAFWAGPSAAPAGTFGFAGLTDPTAGQGWEPLCWVKIYANTAATQHLAIVDCRRDLRDVLQSANEDVTYPRTPRYYERKLQGPTPTNPNAVGVMGQVAATHHGRQFALLTARNQYCATIYSNNGETLAANTLTHVYMVPAISGAITRVPSFGQPTGSSRGRFRGWALASQSVAPLADGTNPAGLRMPTNSLFAEMVEIPAGDAVYLFSATNVGGINFRMFTLVGNRLRYAHSSTTNGAPVVVSGTGVWTSDTAYAINLLGFVPRCARSVQLAFEVDGSAANHEGLRIGVRVGRLSGATIPDARTLARGTLVVAENGQTSAVVLDVPLPVGDDADPVDADSNAFLTGMNIQLKAADAHDTAAYRVRVMGFDL